ncbi:MAG: UDP-2,3-diacylglucosamine diphosphatase [Pseudodonghicola sp.]|uniref:UDP-2,3-diacylglucosamine diphosphatase n=1 Tax=Pseudodonghicola sp. TaxID=1969463 RepID=UPI003A96B446
MDDGSSFFPAPTSHIAEATAGRTLFLSDLHLGMIGSKAELLLEFLRLHDAETIYLVGDLIDTWRPLGNNWPDSHHAVLRQLTRLAQAGRRVIYVPGNHDAFFRHHCGTGLFGFEIRHEAVHHTADGRRLLITHGDCCDIFSGRLAMLSRAGSLAETGVRRLGRTINALRHRLGHDGWDGLEAVLARINRLIRARDRFEERLYRMASERGFDGIVCGHFHKPALHSDYGALYANCGDWVDHATAVIEDHDGSLRLVHWPEGVVPVAGQQHGLHPEPA